MGIQNRMATENYVQTNFTWELVNSVVGEESITLPDIFNELNIEVKYWETCGLFNIPRIALSDAEKYYLNGFYGASTSYGYFYINVSLSTVKIFEVYFNGVNVTSECTITVYKR